MPQEIEHKYLISAEAFQKIIFEKTISISQGYLAVDPEKTVRIRTTDTKGFITIKGKTTGASRSEFEYEIPLSEAQELLKDFCSQLIEKKRHYFLHENKTWEVDEFLGLNKGLFVAEIELDHEEDAYAKPEWLGENVTNDYRYANSNLSKKPFSSW